MLLHRQVTHRVLRTLKIRLISGLRLNHRLTGNYYFDNNPGHVA